MCQQYRAVNTGVLCVVSPGRQRRRVWLEPGQRLVIGKDLTLAVFIDRLGDGSYEPRVCIDGKVVHFESKVPERCWVDISGWAGLMAIPRAYELDTRSARERPVRVLMEFVALRKDVQLVH